MEKREDKFGEHLTVLGHPLDISQVKRVLRLPLKWDEAEAERLRALGYTVKPFNDVEDVGGCGEKEVPCQRIMLVW